MQTLRGSKIVGRAATRSCEVQEQGPSKSPSRCATLTEFAEFASRRIEMAATGRFVTTSPQSVLLLHLDPTVALTGCR